MIRETVLWWMPISDAMRFSAVPSVCAARIDATTAAGFRNLYPAGNVIRGMRTLDVIDATRLD